MAITPTLACSLVQVGPDSMVGDGTRIDERTVVKRSVVGRQCVIGRDVKIINSVLMDHVTVPDRCGGGGATHRAVAPKHAECHCAPMPVLLFFSVADSRATLENVVVGSFATLGEDCNLKDCEVSYGATVGKGRTRARPHGIGGAGRCG